jgi:hypothetical protein
MTDTSGTSGQGGQQSAWEMPDWLKQPPAWYSAAPHSAPQPAASYPPASGSSGEDLRTILNGLPEKVVNAIREATQPAQHAAPPVQQQQQVAAPPAAETQQQETEQAPGPLSFGERWFAR